MKSRFNVVLVLVALMLVQGCAATATPTPAVAIPPREAAIERWPITTPKQQPNWEAG